MNNIKRQCKPHKDMQTESALGLCNDSPTLGLGGAIGKFTLELLRPLSSRDYDVAVEGESEPVGKCSHEMSRPLSSRDYSLDPSFLEEENQMLREMRRAIREQKNLSQAPSKLLTIEEATAYMHPTYTAGAIRKAIECGDLVANTFGTCRLYIHLDEMIGFIKRGTRNNSVTPKREAVEHKCLGKNMVTEYLEREKHSAASSAPARKN